MHKAPTAPRILIARLSAHGDVMHALPLLSAIKRADPQAYVGWLVEASAAPLLQNHPLIDRLHVSQRKRWLRMLCNPLRWPVLIADVAEFICQLRQERYEISLDAQGLFKSAIWPWLALVPRRYGFDRSRENAAWFYTHRLPPRNTRGTDKPAIEEYRDLARALGYETGPPEFAIPYPPPASIEKVDAWLANVPAGRPIVVLAPFTRWASKHWIAEHWIGLLRELLSLDTQPVILGAPGDRQAVDAMLSALSEAELGRVLNLTGETDWPDLYALYARTRLVIGLDSAPLHIANAVGIPALIGIFGPTAAGRTGPVGDRQTAFTTQLECQPCWRHHCPLGTQACMHAITPAMILAEVRRYLGQPEATSA